MMHGSCEICTSCIFLSNFDWFGKDVSSPSSVTLIYESSFDSVTELPNMREGTHSIIAPSFSCLEPTSGLSIVSISGLPALSTARHMKLPLQVSSPIEMTLSGITSTSSWELLIHQHSR